LVNYVVVKAKKLSPSKLFERQMSGSMHSLEFCDWNGR